MCSMAGQGSICIRVPSPLLLLLLKKARTIPMSFKRADKKALRNSEKEHRVGYRGLRAHKGLRENMAFL